MGVKHDRIGKGNIKIRIQQKISEILLCKNLGQQFIRHISPISWTILLIKRSVNSLWEAINASTLIPTSIFHSAVKIFVFRQILFIKILFFRKSLNKNYRMVNNESWLAKFFATIIQSKSFRKTNLIFLVKIIFNGK